MSSPRPMSLVFFAVAILFFIINQELKILTFISWMCVLFGCACLFKFKSAQLPLKGKSVLITGCDTGFGHDLAVALDKLGVIVFAGCLFPEHPDAKSLKAKCSENVHIVKLDITNDSDVTNAVKIVREKSDTLWAVVNNAGMQPYTDIDTCPLKDIIKVMDINYFGMVRVTKAFLSMIRSSKGRVINVTSVKGQLTIPTCGPYCASKFAGEAFSDALRMEMKRFGVDVCIIEPCNFGGLTMIKNEDFLRGEFEKVWDQMDTELREAYGKEYIDCQLNGMIESAKTSYKTTEPVINAMIDSIAAEFPNERYLIGGSNEIVDRYKILCILGYYLPTDFIDYILNLWCIKPMVLPKSLRKDKSE